MALHKKWVAWVILIDGFLGRKSAVTKLVLVRPKKLKSMVQGGPLPVVNGVTWVAITPINGRT